MNMASDIAAAPVVTRYIGVGTTVKRRHDGYHVIKTANTRYHAILVA